MVRFSLLLAAVLVLFASTARAECTRCADGSVVCDVPVIVHNGPVVAPILGAPFRVVARLQPIRRVFGLARGICERRAARVAYRRAQRRGG